MEDNSKNQQTCQTVPLFAVYVIWCRLTDQFYVGVTSQASVYMRIRQHKYNKRQFIDLEIRRIGWEGNYDWWVVETGVSFDQISECEKKWIAIFDCVYPKGYNRTTGGIKFFKHTEESKAKNRQSNLGRKHTEEELAKMRGRRHTDETKAKIGKGNRGKKRTEEQKEKYRQAHLGKPLSEERKANLSKSRVGKTNGFLGKHHTEEAKERNRQAHLGKHHTEETKAILREKALARAAAKRAAKAIAEENLAVANSPPTSLSTLLDAVVFQ